MAAEQREITKEYYEALAIKKRGLLDKAKTAEDRTEFLDTFDHIVRLNRIQMGLLAEMYPDIQPAKHVEEKKDD